MNQDSISCWAFMKTLIISIILLMPNICLAQTIYSRVEKLYNSGRALDPDYITDELILTGNLIKSSTPDTLESDSEALFVVIGDDILDEQRKYGAIFQNQPEIPHAMTFTSMHRRISDGKFTPLTLKNNELSGHSCSTSGKTMGFTSFRVVLIKKKWRIIGKQTRPDSISYILVK